jgi:hypothetical protein
LDADSAPDDPLDDDDSDADDDSADGSATATHGVVATAVPMPSATASAPTRPTYFALPISAPPIRRREIRIAATRRLG